MPYKETESPKTALSGYYVCVSHNLLLMTSGADTHTHTYQRSNKNNFKKRRPRVPGLKMKNALYKIAMLEPSPLIYILQSCGLPYKQKIWHGIKFGGWQFFEITKFISLITNLLVFYYTIQPLNRHI